MELIFKILTLLLGIVAVVSFFWIMVGIPAGIVILILFFTSKDKDKKAKYKKWLKISFGGILVMILVMLLWAVVSAIGVFSGVQLAPPLPN